VPDFRGGRKDDVTLRHVLTHTGGLMWWLPLYREVKSIEEAAWRAAQEPLAQDLGAFKYSDLGYIMLTQALAEVGGAPYGKLVRERVLGPVEAEHAAFGPLRPEDCVATERDGEWRRKRLRGEVHDENAFAMGGVAGHAGLFGTAPDLARFAQMMLNGGVYDHQRIVSRATLERFTRRGSVPGSTRAYGWDTPGDNNSAGSLLSAHAFGHTGFTGTSMWIDADRKLFVILLTNRVHPTRENNAIREVRRAVADAVVRGLETPAAASQH
jgi:CubicO group peptidase (beta-lactamase class C family)